MSESLQAEVREEVEALHRFFVDWFSGRVADSGDIFRVQFTDRFDPRCVLILPAATALDLGALADDIRARHGSNPEFRIQTAVLRQLPLPAATSRAPFLFRPALRAQGQESVEAIRVSHSIGESSGAR